MVARVAPPVVTVNTDNTIEELGTLNNSTSVSLDIGAEMVRLVP
jgi:hypothetical protein